MHLWQRTPKLAAILTAACGVCLIFAQNAHAVWPGDNGKIVFWRFAGSISAPQAQIYSIDSDGLHPVNLSAAGGGANQLDIQPSVSPNGKRITFTRVDLASFTSQIWTMKLDGSDQTNVSNDITVASESGPAWSEDGSRILFVRQATGAGPFGGFGTIWSRPSNGHGTPHQLTSGPDANPTMSPDGDLIAYTHITATGPVINLMKADGSEPPTPLVHGVKPDWSPDGKRIVYGQGGSGPIMVVNLSDPSSPIRLTFGPGINEAPAWSPDGADIAFIHCTGPMVCDLALMTASGQHQHTITNAAAQGMSDQKPDWQRAHGERGEKD
jgi:Tol biopolymer transport system component